MNQTISFDIFRFDQEMINTLRKFKIELISISPTTTPPDIEHLRIELRGKHLNLQKLLKFWDIYEYTTKIEYN